MTNKNILTGAVGVVGSVIVHELGGWTVGLQTLVYFMAVDYITGLVVAGVFHLSSKSSSGGLESRAGWKGLARKCLTLGLVFVAYRIDLMLGTDLLHNAVIIGFICNEAISILENAGLMGLPIPDKLKDAIELLRQKTEDK